MSIWQKIIIFLLFLVLSAPSANLGDLLNDYLNTESPIMREKIMRAILKEKPSVDTIIKLLKNIDYEEPVKKGLIVSENQCIDGVKRPFCWYIPETYDPQKKTPLIVYLHGGVSTPDIPDSIEEYVKEESFFLAFAEKNSYILLFPFGQAGATWWDSVGVSNVLSQIRITKKKFNIDDNRVFMTGFSDGGSGSFFFAMCYPTDFAGFIPLNGHPGVGSNNGGIQTYFVNLYNRPLYVINTDLDRLYPDKEMGPVMELAQNAGANILYRIYTGIGHDFAYGNKEIPLFNKFIELHPRNLNQSVIRWETAYPKLGRCMWFSIDSINPAGYADWYKDYNMELINDRIVFGFWPDDKYKGSGVRVAKVVGDSSLCALIGIKEGDIFVKLEGKEVKSIDDINDYKAKKKRGDLTEIAIQRDGSEINLKGKFPEVTKYNLFRRGLPSACVGVSFSANKFYIKSSQLGAFTNYIDPDMVQLDQNVIIYVDGKKVYDDRVKPDLEFIIRNFFENWDREQIYVNKIHISLK